MFRDPGHYRKGRHIVLPAVKNDYRELLDYLTTIRHASENGLISRSFEKKWRNAVLIYPKNEISNYSDPLLHKERGAVGRVWLFSIDLERIDQEKYLENWVEKLCQKFLKS